jgi:hypothetical protein
MQSKCKQSCKHMKTIERQATKAPWNENQWNSGMKKQHNT